jgi:hypothetical protein
MDVTAVCDGKIVVLKLAFAVLAECRHRRSLVSFSSNLSGGSRFAS